ncbi:MAG: hypothetical protein K0R78_1728 [Pelosinus sp.]|jgi:hypothetical protein|nr:hypothetical protein [Pelosinus sp.]
MAKGREKLSFSGSKGYCGVKAVEGEWGEQKIILQNYSFREVFFVDR